MSNSSPNKAPFYRKDELTEQEVEELSTIAAHRIRDAKTKLVLKPNMRFWTYLLCSLDITPKNTGFGTVATDGYKLYYDPLGHIHEWSTQELEGAIVHEIAHCAFGHYWRCGSRDPLIWNMATDYIINYILREHEKITLPPNTLFDPLFTSELSAEALYSILIKDKEKAIEKLKEILDDPELFKQAIDNANGNGDGDGHGGITIDGIPVNPGDIRDEDWWKEKLQQAGIFAKTRGTLPGYLENLIGDFVEPKLPWRELLREFITQMNVNDYRTLPPKKKYVWMGVYLADVKKEELEVCVVMDTSGSVSDEEAAQFISEIRAIADAYENYSIRYMQCDASVKFDEVLTKENEHNWPMHIVGRGGTSFKPPFERLEEDDYTPPILIYLTDLGGDFPLEPYYPVLWISTVESASHPWGDRINIDVNDRRHRR